MPVIETKGAASSQGFGQFASTTAPVYIEDVFSTYLYTGSFSATNIVNGIDLSSKGGLVWTKSRNGAYSNNLVDTARGSSALFSNLTDAQASGYTWTANSNGYTLSTSDSTWNSPYSDYVSWTFRKQPKFFDVVTYTGDGVGAGKVINHNLKSSPGAVIIKRTDSTGFWWTKHRSLSGSDVLALDDTFAAYNSGSGASNLTSTSFTAKANSNINGATYIAYLFAHNAGGFGLSGTDNVISCGSFTTDGSGGASVNLGWEPQWVFLKAASTSGYDSLLLDNMRGFPASGDARYLRAESFASEGARLVYANATGFSSVNNLGPNITWVYIAIRRGPMKVPTSGTSVFTPVAYIGTASTGTVTTNIVTDASIFAQRSDLHNTRSAARITGVQYLSTNLTNSELDGSTDGLFQANAWDLMNGVKVNTTLYGNTDYGSWRFRRAPSFFDVVCYTGTGAALSLSHNLGVAPELIICKNRNGTPTVTNWMVASLARSSTLQSVARLNTNDAFFSNNAYFNAAPSAATFPVDVLLSASSVNYIAYLFASCPGVSKVGTYTGTGTTLQIDCGFTGGARFVMIKRTNSTGDWFVFDTARGLVAGDDPYLLFNSINPEIPVDYIDPLSSGFELNSTGSTSINVNGGTYVFLAIA